MDAFTVICIIKVCILYISLLQLKEYIYIKYNNNICIWDQCLYRSLEIFRENRKTLFMKRKTSAQKFIRLTRKHVSPHSFSASYSWFIPPVWCQEILTDIFRLENLRNVLLYSVYLDLRVKPFDKCA